MKIPLLNRPTDIAFYTMSWQAQHIFLNAICCALGVSHMGHSMQYFDAILGPNIVDCGLNFYKLRWISRLERVGRGGRAV
jgi:hypothetical protein